MKSLWLRLEYSVGINRSLAMLTDFHYCNLLELIIVLVVVHCVERKAWKGCSIGGGHSAHHVSDGSVTGIIQTVPLGLIVSCPSFVSIEAQILIVRKQ